MRDLAADILAGGNGWPLTYNLFADESYCEETGHLIIAGYLIGCKALDRFTEAWKAVLQEGCLPYFHMKEGHHRSHPDTYASLVNLVTYDYITAGFCASVLKQEYDSVFRRRVRGHRGKATQPLSYWMGGSYSFCGETIAQLANRWLDSNNPEEKDMSYVFDAGNEKQHEASTFLEMIAADPLMSAKKHALRFYSYSFVDGKRLDGGALQAADMLAWNIAYRQRTKRWDTIGSKIIASVQVYSLHLGPDALLETISNQEQFWQEYGSLKRANIIHPH